nr:ribonuclease E [Chroomonas debatzensis]
MSSRGTKLVISEKNQLAAVYKDNEIEDLYIAHSSYQISSIYIGKVDKLVSNINAAFIKLDPLEKNGFIDLEKVNSQPNTKLKFLSPNKKVFVQIIKEPSNTKGPSVTTNIGISGQYFVLLPFGRGINISKKLYDQQEKNYLKGIITLLKPLSLGVLIKKEAQNQLEEDLINDFLFIQKKWNSIKLRATCTLTPTRLTSNIVFMKKVVQRLHTFKTSHILVDTQRGAWKVYNELKHFKQPYNYKLLKIIYQKKQPSLVKILHLDLALYSFLQPRINLNGGGYIIIERTEALTAIDINTGSFKELKNFRATLLWINCEAATEIVKQLKLRNLGGIIVVDFIDMIYKKDQMILLNHLNTLLKTDWANPKLIQLSEIGLVELTRKREGQNIYDIFGQKCEQCAGAGQSIRFLKTKTRNITKMHILETAPIYSNK